MKTRLATAAIAVSCLLLPLLPTSGSVSAEAGSCQASTTACTRHYSDSGAHYRFYASQGDLRDFRYLTTSDTRVADNFGAIRINSASYARMCIYANLEFASPLYWVVTHNIWATTNRAGMSLRLKTSNTSC